jgi:hypothetical protein
MRYAGAGDAVQKAKEIDSVPFSGGYVMIVKGKSVVYQGPAAPTEKSTTPSTGGGGE